MSQRCARISMMARSSKAPLRGRIHYCSNSVRPSKDHPCDARPGHTKWHQAAIPEAGSLLPLLDTETGRPSRTAVPAGRDPLVWTDRALQEGMSRRAACGLASMYPASVWSVWCSGPAWVSARIRSHYRIGLEGPFGSPVFGCAGETVPPSSLQSISQTSVGNSEIALLKRRSIHFCPPALKGLSKSSPRSHRRSLARTGERRWRRGDGGHPLGEPERAHAARADGCA